jgi:hypothetical protein
MANLEFEPDHQSADIYVCSMFGQQLLRVIIDRYITQRIQPMLDVNLQYYRSRAWSRDRTARALWALAPIAISLAPVFALALFAAFAAPASMPADFTGDPPVTLIGP